MHILWKIFCDCKSKEAARKVAARHFEVTCSVPRELNVEPYDKGGFVVTGHTDLAAMDWANSVFETLAIAQSAAAAWTLSGDITESLDIWTQKSGVPGIRSIHLVMDNPNQA